MPKNADMERVSDAEGDEVVISYSDRKGIAEKLERGSWGGKLEFMLTCVGFAVGLGNVWRFPYLCYKNGGGAFLVPYIIMLATVGLPLFFLEFALGQFASLGPISVWNISPMLRGVGFAMVITSWYLAIYYNVIVTHCIYYFFASMSSVLPWSDCKPSWTNYNNCLSASGNNQHLINSSNVVSSAEIYYYQEVLNISDGLSDFGWPSPILLVILFCSWVVCTIVLIKGVSSLGKTAYFTATFPYVMLTVLLIRSFFLPGAFNGISYYLMPRASRLLDIKVWSDAATQIFFSLSCCNGGLITMSSYNKFKNNVYKDALAVALINCGTSVYAGFVIFANLGYMAYVKNATIDEVAVSGPGLAFVVYPQALTQMPMSTMWAILFFFMFAVLGMGSQFSVVETVLSGLQDELRLVGIITKQWHILVYRISICFVSFILGIFMVCPAGMYLVQLVDWTVSGFPLLVIALIEFIVICGVYGIFQFERDIQLMIKEKPRLYWRIMWCAVTPTIVLILLILYFVMGGELVYRDYHYPSWSYTFAYVIAAIPLSCIPFFFMLHYCREGGFEVLLENLKPIQTWGPAIAEHRTEYLEVISSKNKNLDLLCAEDASACCANPTAMYNVVHSAVELSNHLEEHTSHFFQSRQGLVNRLSRKASKEALAQSRIEADPTEMFGDETGAHPVNIHQLPPSSVHHSSDAIAKEVAAKLYGKALQAVAHEEEKKLLNGEDLDA